MTQATDTRDIRDSDGFVEAATMLVDFHREYDYPAPDPDFLAQHLSRLVESGDTSVLTFGTPAIGVAVLRFRTGTWTADLESYLAEFYIKPGLRGKGYGTTFLDDVIDHVRTRGATYLDLNTSEDDEAARHVYEKRGFDCHEGHGEGPMALYYELDLA
ncbi:Acetyltransferase, putative [Rhodococcus sp. AW25M09]|uniref:GNAT family N-acetyltransferase n=1 Tax=Rhodococcus sp. AW25M09 TaxID=1268303 RepID=UPI0002ACA080|nr:GNAT family N-acetyltransferase [Rhodococcus sp. AW25M09]CCQ14056.1 Acetyltransferase, putative [Rhodococcus sp. AW25M09]